MHQDFTRYGFLPHPDPLRRLTGELEPLDDLGRDLPSLLEDKDARLYLKEFKVPRWPKDTLVAADLPALRLYYVRLGFVASGYINQIGQPPATKLPANIAVPLCHAAKVLDRPPILSYDGYALYNWKRFDPAGPIALGNIDTVQNFVHLYDERWPERVLERYNTALKTLKDISAGKASLGLDGSNKTTGQSGGVQYVAPDRVFDPGTLSDYAES